MIIIIIIIIIFVWQYPHINNPKIINKSYLTINICLTMLGFPIPWVATLSKIKYMTVANFFFYPFISLSLLRFPSSASKSVLSSFLYFLADSSLFSNSFLLRSVPAAAFRILFLIRWMYIWFIYIHGTHNCNWMQLSCLI